MDIRMEREAWHPLSLDYPFLSPIKNEIVSNKTGLPGICKKLPDELNSILTLTDKMNRQEKLYKSQSFYVYGKWKMFAAHKRSLFAIGFMQMDIAILGKDWRR